MFEELKKALLAELNEKSRFIDEEQERLRAELVDVKSTINKYNAIFPLDDERFKEFKRGYSKISKFFNRKKYVKESQTLFAELKAEYDAKVDEGRKKASSIQKQISDGKKASEDIAQKIQLVNSMVTLSELQISFDEAKELLTKNGINIFDYTYMELLQLGPSIETTGNVSFMRKATIEYPFSIMYDQTNDFDMYHDFISGLVYEKSGANNSVEIQNEEFFNNNKRTVLDFLEQSRDGKIRIIPKYIMEAIRFYFKDVIIVVNGGTFELGDNKEVYDALYRIAEICKRSQALSDDEYHMLENIYIPEENDYYCHRTTGEMTEKDLNSILSNGLTISHEWGTTCCIGANARKIDCFLALAGYQNFYGGHYRRGDICRIIIAIPKGTERPIGSDRTDGIDSHILPQYTIAFMRDIVDEHGNLVNATLHINNLPRKVYRYLYEDFYDPIHPFPIENEELMDTMEDTSGNQYH